MIEFFQYVTTNTSLMALISALLGAVVGATLSGTVSFFLQKREFRKRKIAEYKNALTQAEASFMEIAVLTQFNCETYSEISKAIEKGGYSYNTAALIEHKEVNISNIINGNLVNSIATAYIDAGMINAAINSFNHFYNEIRYTVHDLHLRSNNQSLDPGILQHDIETIETQLDQLLKYNSNHKARCIKIIAMIRVVIVKIDDSKYKNLPKDKIEPDKVSREEEKILKELEGALVDIGDNG